jgi:hypothetical protein
MPPAASRLGSDSSGNAAGGDITSSEPLGSTGAAAAVAAVIASTAYAVEMVVCRLALGALREDILAGFCGDGTMRPLNVSEPISAGAEGASTAGAAMGGGATTAAAEADALLPAAAPAAEREREADTAAVLAPTPAGPALSDTATGAVAAAAAATPSARVRPLGAWDA